jgi:hypothetical protein
MARVAAMVLAVSFLCLGTGLLRYAHDAAHAREDANKTVPDPRPHDETNCDLHARLSAPMTAAPVLPALVLLGVFVAFLTLLPTPVAHLRLPGRIDCRGPPTLPA